MSGKRAKQARRITRLRFVCEVLSWLEREPPLWKLRARRRWKQEMPRRFKERGAQRALDTERAYRTFLTEAVKGWWR